MAKIRLDYLDLGISDQIVRLKEIKTALTGNAAFPALAPGVLAFGLGIDGLSADDAQYEAAMTLARQKMTVRDQSRAGVLEMARQLASASEAATNDPAELQSGGWMLRSAPAPVGALPAPANVSATGGDQEGEADLVWQPVSGRQTYVGEHAASATGPWTQFYIGKKSSCTATGLSSGQAYWFRIRAVGAAGPGPWSDPAQARAT